ncbi:MAG: hypothetical protein Q8R16_01640 [bacterium]|nr:hypothetical protein [bacterium]
MRSGRSRSKAASRKGRWSSTVKVLSSITDGTPEEIILYWMWAMPRWSEARLSEGLAAEIFRLVREPGIWQEAYRAAIHKSMDRLDVVRWSPQWSPDIAQNAREVKTAATETWCGVPLPHLGPEQHIVVRAHVDGTWWSDPTTGTTGLVPFDRTTHQWGDEVTGPIVTQIRVASPLDFPKDDLWRAACTVREIAEGRRVRRARAIARAVAHELALGRFPELLRGAAAIFDEGQEHDPYDDQYWAVFYALVIRRSLATIAQSHGDPVLLAALVKADHALAPHSSAVLLLDEELYRDAVGYVSVDPDAWWGYRARLNCEMPESRLYAAFAVMRSRMSTRP